MLGALEIDSLWVLCVLLFVDGATIAASSTVLVLAYGRNHEPWAVATVGAAASALGSGVQLALLRWILSSRHPWMARFAPSREKIEAALARYPSTSFLMLAVFRATPLPDAPLKLVAAVIEYPVRLYALASFIGTVPYFFVLALIGNKFKVPLWVIAAGFGLVGLGILVDWLRKRKRPAAVDPTPPRC